MDKSGISLREHFDRRLEDFDRRLTEARRADAEKVQLAFDAAKEALKTADVARDKRLDLLNEFRAQAKDEAAKYATRESLDALERRLSAQELVSATIQGRALALAGFGALVGGTAVAVLMKLL